MSDPSENSALVELLDGIADRRIRRKIKKLLERGEEAVRSLGELDSALYTGGNAEDQLQVISDAVLSHVRRLLEYIGSIAATVVKKEPADEDLDFEFAEGDSLDMTEIAESLNKAAQQGGGSHGAGKEKTEEDKWRELALELDTLQYGLGSELKEFDRRFSDAMEHDRVDQALRDLNDATRSLVDGVFAMISTVYELFLGYVDPGRMIPGHRDTLGKALGVRRKLAELRGEVQELNRVIQDPEGSSVAVEMSYRLFVASLADFINDEVFSWLRSSDRKEFAAFSERLAEGNASRNRLDCEGFDKYLDSLAVVSQRDVLIKHDNDLREKICAEIDQALSLADFRPRRVPGIIGPAFEKADRLFGLIEEVDTLVFKWSQLSDEQRNDPQEALAMGRSLKELVQLPKAAPPPDDGDFF